ncbi:DUF1254 domain-containing protein [Pseudoalteromonas shioyasakiensis]|uniref:DUF1254 domain-containing protein n=1 Tax=Pseudoalteromonas shioyasakiensis TaxID=1190813 RepID=A0ABT6U3A9_9GAMM|nr:MULTISPECIES: DUF1254 domain-containing protein [Pseudoalteromonas]MDI4670646.1 DUF1254 domain-containing protein [Pseudoalteromonas shioyasakiensis]MDI4675353.1 DUF1254 domain-containing protein [Pseudoalteromonas shioyasakiensis]MDI4687635.1 DUF1254 domain-containing protein [Pseudoalteromonas shioyasakiensis]MDI4706150.1 DUF1254 domain-containing protein [Pseudoalteromonas shioyasakiensis]
MRLMLNTSIFIIAALTLAGCGDNKTETTNSEDIKTASSTIKSTQKLVTPENYIRAEDDFSFFDFQLRAGGKINEFFYITEPTPLDQQSVVRMNKDTLYAGAVVDTEGGATVTIPEFPDDRYFSVYVVDNDHYATAVFYESGTHALPNTTKYQAVIQRIQLLAPDDPADVALVNELKRKLSFLQIVMTLFQSQTGIRHQCLNFALTMKKSFKNSRNTKLIGWVKKEKLTNKAAT